MKRLDVEHPYYMVCGIYHENFESFDKFLSDSGDLDDDLNLIFRWDLEYHNKHRAEGELNLYYIAQRIGNTRCCHVKINRNDENRIREFLESKWEKIKEMWEPFSS